MHNNTINIIIAEDHALYREALVKELKPYHIDCIGEASNGKEAIKLISQHKVSIVLLDLEMPEMDGKQTLQLIKEKYPNVKTIIVSQHDDFNLTEHFENIGAQGYLPKSYISGDVHLLAEAIRDVDLGKTCFVYGNKKEYVKYTNRERDIIPLICEGKANKEIAAMLGISEKVIEKHRKNLFEKTKTKSVGAFIKFSIKRGLDFLGSK